MMDLSRIVEQLNELNVTEEQLSLVTFSELTPDELLHMLNNFFHKISPNTIKPLNNQVCMRNSSKSAIATRLFNELPNVFA